MLGDPAPTPFDRGLLRLGHDLRRLGSDDPARHGWHHVRHGVWVEASTWRALTPERRHAALVHATDLVSRAPGEHVFALESAAAVWGLPHVGPFPGHVSRLATGPRTRGSRLVKVHVGAPAEAVVVHGLLVTDVPRTVVDLARTGSLARGLAAADHALRHGLCTRAQLVDAAAGIPARVRGRPRALLVAELADARSMSAGESLSRATMFRLNLPRPELQVPVEDAAGLIGVADFAWEGVVGEFDGRRKYGVAPDADPTEAAEVLWREKRREDRFRRQVRVARWVWAEAGDDARWPASWLSRAFARRHATRGSTSARWPREFLDGGRLWFGCRAGGGPLGWRRDDATIRAEHRHSGRWTRGQPTSRPRRPCAEPQLARGHRQQRARGTGRGAIGSSGSPPPRRG